MFSPIKKIYFVCGFLALTSLGFAYARSNYEEAVLSKLILMCYPLTDAQGYESLDKIKKHDDQAYNDILEIKTRVVNTLWWQSFVYDITKRIDQEIINQFIDYVYEMAVHEVMQYTNDYRLAQRVGNQMKQDVVNIYNQYIELPRGAFKNFIGNKGRQNALKYANIVAQSSYSSHQQVGPQIQSTESNIQLYTPKGELKTYPDTECCICFESLNDSNRIFLPTSDHVRVSYGFGEYDTCGHDLCKTCARSNFLKHDHKECPKCRAFISKNMLRRILSHNQ